MTHNQYKMIKERRFYFQFILRNLFFMYIFICRHFRILLSHFFIQPNYCWYSCSISKKKTWFSGNEMTLSPCSNLVVENDN